MNNLNNSNNGKNTQKGAKTPKNAASGKKSAPLVKKSQGVARPINSPSVSVGSFGSVPTSVKRAKKGKQTALKGGFRTAGLKKRDPSALRPVRSPKIITIAKTEKSPFPTAMAFTSVIITVLFLFMIMNYIQIDKYNNEISSLNTQITRLKNTEYELRTSLEKKDNLSYIDDYARNQLGMVKSESVPRYYIPILPGDKSEIIKYDDKGEGGLGFMFSGLGEVLRDFWR